MSAATSTALYMATASVLLAVLVAAVLLLVGSRRARWAVCGVAPDGTCQVIHTFDCRDSAEVVRIAMSTSPSRLRGWHYVVEAAR